MGITDNLRSIRKMHKLSQADVAEILNTTQQQYSKYENGTHEIPIRHIVALCQYYNVSSDSILGIKKTRTKENVDALLALDYIEKLTFTSYRDFTEKAHKEGKLDYLMEIFGGLWLYILVSEKLGIPTDPQIVARLETFDD